MKKTLLILALVSLLLTLCACGSTKKTNDPKQPTDKNPTVTEETIEPSEAIIPSEPSQPSGTESSKPAATDTPQPQATDAPQSDDQPISPGESYELPKDEL